MKKISGALIGLFIFLSIAGVRAAGASGSCNLSKSDFDALQSLPDQNLSYSDEIILELQTRKKLLGEALDCAVFEANQEKDILNTITTVSADASEIKMNLLSQIDDVLRYYATQMTLVDGLGLSGSRDFAKNLADWRNGNYKPLAQRTNYFIIWSSNQPLISTAQSRLNQIKQILDSFGLNLSNDLSSIFDKAQMSLNAAAADNQNALVAIKGSSNDALQFIKLSLEELSDAYQRFFEISAAVGRSESP